MSDRKVVISCFYELPDGRIAWPYGSDGTGGVRVRFDDDHPGIIVPMAEFRGWTPRHDLMDFPTARDPRLPYTFDLFFDIKTRSQLVALLKEGFPNGETQSLNEVRDAMARHSIVLTEAEEATLQPDTATAETPAFKP